MLFAVIALTVACELCQAQMMYSRVVPYDSPYILRRPPVRRSAMDTLERLRLPVARYFPQVDTQVASAPYRANFAPVSAYQRTPEDVYAFPPQWTDDVVPDRADEDPDYANYEYESAIDPIYTPGMYGDEVYAQEPLMEPEASDSGLYNDLMVNYLMSGAQRKPMDESEMFGMQRRSQNTINNNQAMNDKLGVISLSGVFEANKNATGSSNNAAALTPPSPTPSHTVPQVQVTAVPSAPEKKEVKSLVIPEPSFTSQSNGVWPDEGQKEVPLFRPLQNSQRTKWGDLTRVKNSQNKSPIPLLKQMIKAGQQKAFDPLTEELNDLKKQPKA